jgi:iron complex transport system substrate-binding protein
MKIINTVLAIMVLCGPSLFPERIVSLAPALTEIIFELGHGDSLVGITRFCDFPGPVNNLTRVGGLMDLNLEILIQLKPDLIILYPESLDKIKVLRSRARLLPVSHRNLADLYHSIGKISRALEAEEKGKELVLKLNKKLEAIRQKTVGRPKIKTLLIAGRNPDQLSNLTLIGQKDFLNEILEICGGRNAYQGKIDYPSVSVESIVSLNPEWIIEFSIFFQDIDRKRVRDLWKRYPIIQAVKKGNIEIIVDPKWLRPGPRIAEVAAELFRLLDSHD